jgi:CRP/FNR family transcriptional regulator, cyclic AMP receptor protein
MSRTHFAEGQILFREGDPADGVFRLLSGTIDVLRELGGDPILLGSVGPVQFIGEMGVLENRPRSATARAASEVQVEFLTPPEFLEQIANSPRAARDLIQRLCQRLREADDRIVNDERRSIQAHENGNIAGGHTVVSAANTLFLAANDPWLQQQLQARFELSNLPFVIGRRPTAQEGPPLRQPDLTLDVSRRSGYRATTS